jgi:hypothetical protein
MSDVPGERLGYADPDGITAAFDLLNVAVGGAFSQRPDSATALPQTMLVDHIRVYTASATSG